MRVARLLAVSLVLISGSVSAAFAVEPDNVQTGGSEQSSDSPAQAPAQVAVPDASQTAMQPQPATDAPQAAPSAPEAAAPSSTEATTPAPTPPSAAEATSAPKPDASAPAAPPKVIADDHLIYLPVASYITANAKKLLASTNADDRQALIQFYTERSGSTLWVDKSGLTPEAKNLIAALNDADSWGAALGRL